MKLIQQPLLHQVSLNRFRLDHGLIHGVRGGVLLPLDVKLRVELPEVVLNGPLDLEVSDGHRALLEILFLSANVLRLPHLSDDVPRTLGEVDHD